MLILSRFVDGKIMIGDDITIEVLSISNKQVRLGFVAPKDVSIHREEVYLKIAAGEPIGDSVDAIAAVSEG